MKTNVRQQNLGFSLLEVLLAMTIIGIVIGMIMGTVQSTIKLSSSIISLQNEARHLRLTEHYLSRLFINLPGQAQLYLTKENGDQQVLRIVNPDTPFPSKGRENLAKELTLSVSNSSAESFVLTMLATNWIEEEASELPEDSYTTDITGPMAEIYFSFYDSREQAWVDEWEPALGKPKMIKCIYRELGDHSEYQQEMVFLVSTQKESNSPFVEAQPAI